MAAPRQSLVASWMLVPGSAGHHYGGVYGRHGHAWTMPATYRYRRTGAPPGTAGPRLTRPTIDHGVTLAPEPPRPRSSGPGRRPLTDRITDWLEARMGWQRELLP